jgi:predicted RNA-binding protein with PUA-like domain
MQVVFYFFVQLKMDDILVTPMTAKKYWLVKSEAECYSIDDFKRDCARAKNGAVPWTGIRNFQARNFMKDGAIGKGMSIGDTVLFYHSNGTPKAPTGVYGIARVASLPHEDMTARDPKDEHFDPKSVEYAKVGKDPLWMCVDMEFVEKFAHPVSLEQIKHATKKSNGSSGMLLTQPGQRLSVIPVAKTHFDMILEMGK